eukprot:358377-Chlamydomonas_euryale.AAC.6
MHSPPAVAGLSHSHFHTLAPAPAPQPFTRPHPCTHFCTPTLTDSPHKSANSTRTQVRDVRSFLEQLNEGGDLLQAGGGRYRVRGANPATVTDSACAGARGRVADGGASHLGGGVSNLGRPEPYCSGDGGGWASAPASQAGVGGLFAGLSQASNGRAGGLAPWAGGGSGVGRSAGVGAAPWGGGGFDV